MKSGRGTARDTEISKDVRTWVEEVDIVSLLVEEHAHRTSHRPNAQHAYLLQYIR